MLNIRLCARLIAPAIGLAWATALPAQRLPSPAAPAVTSATGVVPAEHVFSQEQPNLIQQVSLSPDQCPCGADCQCEDCPYGCSNTGCNWYDAAREGDYLHIFWNPGGEPFNLYDTLAAEMDYDPCIRFGGWYNGGYMNKAEPLGFNKAGDIGHYNVQQAWLWAERVADGSEGFDWGMRIDGMYGVDAADTQSFGNVFGRYDFSRNFQHGKYGFAIPQAYAEVAYGDVSVKLGHFFTIIGYEVVPAPGNFFFSHAFTMYNSEPFTHTGALGTYKLSDDVTLWAGWTAGWDTGFDQVDGGSNWIGGASLALTDDLTLIYASVAGDFGKTRGEGYMQSIVAIADLTDDWQYVFQTDLMDSNGGDYQIGVNQYLFYTVNDWLKAGFRGEWWRASIPGVTDGHNGPISFYETTFGVNVTPNANFTLRPEIRYQWSPAVNNAGPAGPTGLYDAFGEWIFGVDGIWTF
jgi:hypothetical protein